MTAFSLPFSLPLLANVAMAWNTGYVQKILQAGKEEGYGAGGEPLNEKDFDRVSPVAFDFINRLSKDPFMAAAATDEIKLENNGL